LYNASIISSLALYQFRCTTLRRSATPTVLLVFGTEGC
jgi:hypothetical protein